MRHSRPLRLALVLHSDRADQIGQCRLQSQWHTNDQVQVNDQFWQCP